MVKKRENKLSPKHHINLKKRHWIFIIPLVLLVISVGVIYFQNKKSDKAQYYKNLDIYNELEMKQIIHSQKELSDLYVKKTLNEDKATVFYYTMAPLSVFDPIYDPTSFDKPDISINYLYGYYGHKFNIPTDKFNIDVNYPLKQATSFEEFAYFNMNKDELKPMVHEVSKNEDLEILGIWDNNNIYRVNKFFGDERREITWQIEPTESNYKYMINRSTDTNESKQNISLKNKFESILKQMSKNGIQTIYKCEDKIIFIMFAVSDNAFGYIYNASSANDINCGLLKNRFNILKDQQINNEWRYWVAN